MTNPSYRDCLYVYPQLIIFVLCRLEIITLRLSQQDFLPPFLIFKHGSHRKLRTQQFVYYFVCIRCLGEVYNEPLPSNDRAKFTETLPSNYKWIQI
jgi:hypothetical protein